MQTLESQVEMLQAIDRPNLMTDDNKYAVVSLFFMIEKFFYHFKWSQFTDGKSVIELPT